MKSPSNILAGEGESREKEIFIAQLRQQMEKKLSSCGATNLNFTQQR